MSDSNNLASGSTEWNRYWTLQNSGGTLYSYIAEFYRKVLIRPYLNYFIHRYFKRGMTLLHAGCGSGQVDKDLKDYSLIGLDISPSALLLYRQSNGSDARILESSVFEITLPDASVDGIYNLGVMEHFTEEELQKSLGEFSRVVKPEGKIILFWPPEFGTSVLFFKFLRLMSRLFTGKDRKFHPDEINRIRSKKHVTRILEQAGLKMVEYRFTWRDFFTYAVVVAEK